MEPLLFVDIDGVFNHNTIVDTVGGLVPSLVCYLDTIIAVTQCDVVFNTAWNASSLNDMRAFFSKAGLKNSRKLVGQTDACSGGGLPVGRWLRDNNQVGRPYAIIDDSTHGYNGPMWARLIWCPSPIALTNDNVIRAIDILRTTDFDPDRECHRACKHLIERMLWQKKASWLSPEQRQTYLQEDCVRLYEWLNDSNFLEH